MLCVVSEDEWVIQLCDNPNVHISALFYPPVCVYGAWDGIVVKVLRY